MFYKERRILIKHLRRKQIYSLFGRPFALRVDHNKETLKSIIKVSLLRKSILSFDANLGFLCQFRKDDDQFLLFPNFVCLSFVGGACSNQLETNMWLWHAWMTRKIVYQFYEQEWVLDFPYALAFLFEVVSMMTKSSFLLFTTCTLYFFFATIYIDRPLTCRIICRVLIVQFKICWPLTLLLIDAQKMDIVIHF